MAVAGLEVYNANGTIKNTITDSMGRILGTRDISGEGTMDWPYPNVTGKRVVAVCSNRSQGDGYFSYAYAYIHESGLLNGKISYSIGLDRLPMTLIFMVY